MTTSATLVTRDCPQFCSALGLLNGRALRIVGIRVWRRCVRNRGRRILLRVRSSRCTRTGLLIVFTRRVRAALRTPIACTLRLSRERRGYVIVRTHTRSGCVPGDLRARDCIGGHSCVQ